MSYRIPYGINAALAMWRRTALAKLALSTSIACFKRFSSRSEDPEESLVSELSRGLSIGAVTILLTPVVMGDSGVVGLAGSRFRNLEDIDSTMSRVYCEQLGSYSSELASRVDGWAIRTIETCFKYVRYVHIYGRDLQESCYPAIKLVILEMCDCHI